MIRSDEGLVNRGGAILPGFGRAELLLGRNFFLDGDGSDVMGGGGVLRLVFALVREGHGRAAARPYLDSGAIHGKRCSQRRGEAV